MAIRKSVEETFVISGPCDQVLAKCKGALEMGGFGGVKANSTLNQVEGTYHKFTAWGEILITVMPDGVASKIVAKATANVDNIWALLSSPTKKILAAFKDKLG